MDISTLPRPAFARTVSTCTVSTVSYMYIVLTICIQNTIRTQLFSETGEEKVGTQSLELCWRVVSRRANRACHTFWQKTGSVVWRHATLFAASPRVFSPSPCVGMFFFFRLYYRDTYIGLVCMYRIISIYYKAVFGVGSDECPAKSWTTHVENSPRKLIRLREASPLQITSYNFSATIYCAPV